MRQLPLGRPRRAVGGRQLGTLPVVIPPGHRSVVAFLEALRAIG